MTTLTITLSEEQLSQLQEFAARLEVTPEELVSIGVEELLTPPDDSFQQAMSYVLKKNTKLYQQLT
jgi:hypothetical protein